MSPKVSGASTRQIERYSGLAVAADPLPQVPVAAACNPAFVIPSASHWAAAMGDNRLPPPWKPCRLDWVGCDTERKVCPSSG